MSRYLNTIPQGRVERSPFGFEAAALREQFQVELAPQLAEAAVQGAIEAEQQAVVAEAPSLVA